MPLVLTVSVNSLEPAGTVVLKVYLLEEVELMKAKMTYVPVPVAGVLRRPRVWNT